VLIPVRVVSAAVESTYDGPHLPESGEVTAEFMDSLLGKSRRTFMLLCNHPSGETLDLISTGCCGAAERFRGQKLLHKKYVVQLLLAVLKQLKTLPNCVPIRTTELTVRV
jgi:hypothetical protein